MCRHEYAKVKVVKSRSEASPIFAYGVIVLLFKNSSFEILKKLMDIDALLHASTLATSIDPFDTFIY